LNLDFAQTLETCFLEFKMFSERLCFILRLSRKTYN
jgi:hypothetical protein